MALASAPAPAAATDGGGAAAPTSEPGGGAQYRQVAPSKRRPARRRRGGPVLRSFRLSRARLYLFGPPARVTFRIDRGSRLVRVRVAVVPSGGRRAALTLPLGPMRTGVEHSALLTGLRLPRGSYAVRIHVRDRRGRPLRRRGSVASTAPLLVLHHRFPLGGPFDYGGEGSRFGAPRRGHRHQGQDLGAAQGTPVLAPRGGRVEVVAYQARGAGHYVVLDGAGEDRDYVFMHLRTGSIRVRRGQWVRTGRRIADVGSTGGSSGPHLHFEVWVAGGWYTGGHPIDPLPLLRGWERATRSRA